jgi:hypothetical protein
LIPTFYLNKFDEDKTRKLINQEFGDDLNNDMNNLNLTYCNIMGIPKYKLNKNSNFYIYNSEYDYYKNIQRIQKIAKIKIILDNN